MLKIKKLSKSKLILLSSLCLNVNFSINKIDVLLKPAFYYNGHAILPMCVVLCDLFYFAMSDVNGLDAKIVKFSLLSEATYIASLYYCSFQNLVPLPSLPIFYISLLMKSQVIWVKKQNFKLNIAFILLHILCPILSNTIQSSAIINQYINQYILSLFVAIILITPYSSFVILNMISDQSNSNDLLENKIEKIVTDNADLPERVKDLINRDLLSIKSLSKANGEHMKRRLELISNLSWHKPNHENLDINQIRAYLTTQNCLPELIETVSMVIAKQNRTKTMTGAVICLAGPPGIGKTHTAKLIAKALGREFVSLPLGSVKDAFDITGSTLTYQHPSPGLIIQNLQNRKKNCVVLLDEVDKVGTSSHNGNPQDALLEVLDPNQNKNFRDNYLSVEFDLSQIMFIATANDLLRISAPLLDRFTVINLNGYDEDSKIRFAKNENGAISIVMKECNLTADDLEITESALQYLANNDLRIAEQEGLRGLFKVIREICDKVVLTIEMQKPNACSKIVINDQNIEDFIKINRIVWRH